MPDERNTGLAGRRVVITRPRSSGDRLPELLAQRGAVPVIAPALAIEAPSRCEDLDRALAHIDRYDWIVVTSVNAVNAVSARIQALGVADQRLRSVRTAAVGPATAAALVRLGTAPPLLAAEHRAAALAEAMPDVAGRRVLFPCGDKARHELPAILRKRGAAVDAIVAYRTLPASDPSTLVRELALDRADAIVVASPSAVESILSALAQSGVRVTDRRGRPAWFCIGPVTADALRAHGIDADVTGAGALEDFVERIEAWYLRHVAA